MGRKRSAAASQNGKKKSKGVTANDDITIAALKDEAIRNLALGNSKDNKSIAKTPQSERRVDIDRGKEHFGTKSLDSWSAGDQSTTKKIEVGGTLNIEKGGVQVYTRKKKNEDHMKTPMKRKRSADADIVQAYWSSLETTSSRLRARKEAPAFRMVNLDENDNERIVGKRIKVYWSGSRRWFTGRIKGFDDEKRLHRILYEDGDKEELDLKKEQFELEILPTEGFSLRTQTYRGNKKLGALDDGEPTTDILKKESGKVNNAEKVGNSLEPKQETPSKKARKGGRSKSWRKRSNIKKVAKMNVHVLPQVDQVTTDKVSDAETSSEAHSGKKHVEVNKMESYQSDSEKTVTDDSTEVFKVAKRNWTLKRETVSTVTKGRSYNSSNKKESSRGKKPDADMEVDNQHVEFQMKSVDGIINFEEAEKSSNQKERNNTEDVGEVLSEAQATQSGFNAEKKKLCVADGQGTADGNPEILQETPKIDDGETPEDVSKKETNVTGEKAEEAGKAKSKNDAES
ncbi:hypothetical protein CFOL_v3_33928 [Cephalotus follicularis]|uniref:PTM/DIR17-like Tudor domain-containing protein n=1 Tax=Cephalotus follicularis TaxID=3775 RepID=A0A1Q3DDM1_CEPFO|nr:hypothetical protein CFOL_v3_33928 [Cephalotus follicularis]